jgi:hypothetical protein
MLPSRNDSQTWRLGPEAKITNAPSRSRNGTITTIGVVPIGRGIGRGIRAYATRHTTLGIKSRGIADHSIGLETMPRIAAATNSDGRSRIDAQAKKPGVATSTAGTTLSIWSGV